MIDPQILENEERIRDRNKTVGEAEGSLRVGTGQRLTQIMRNDDMDKLNMTEMKLRAVSDLMGIFSSKVHDQDLITQEGKGSLIGVLAYFDF